MKHTLSKPGGPKRTFSILYFFLWCGGIPELQGALNKALNKSWTQNPEKIR